MRRLTANSCADSIVSSPLTLSFDMGNATLMDAVWDLITNTEALAINRAWFGHPGTLKNNSGAKEWQVWSKPLSTDGTMVAVLLVSTSNTATATMTLQLGDFVVSGSAMVRDVWAHKDLGTHSGSMSFPISAAHDSVFLTLTAASAHDAAK